MIYGIDLESLGIYRTVGKKIESMCTRTHGCDKLDVLLNLEGFAIKFRRILENNVSTNSKAK